MENIKINFWQRFWLEEHAKIVRIQEMKCQIENLKL